MEPERVVDCRCQTGENPRWHPDERRLYWIDIPAGLLYRSGAETGTYEICYQGEPIGGFTIQDDGGILLFQDHCAIRLWQQGRVTTLREELPGERITRFNDALADPFGRVFSGTMPAEGHPASLYRLDPDGTVTRVLEGRGQSNGMGFTPDLTGFYWTDTRRRTISRFSYDVNTGALSSERVVVRVAEGDGVPDGMCVDVEGYIWSAHWGAGCVVRYDPDGREVQRVRFPAAQASCPTFGGDDYTELFVATAGGDDRSKNGTGAGAVFRLRPEVPGMPGCRSRINAHALRI